MKKKKGKGKEERKQEIEKEETPVQPNSPNPPLSPRPNSFCAGPTAHPAQPAPQLFPSAALASSPHRPKRTALSPTVQLTPLRALTPLARRPLAQAHASAPLTPRLPFFFCRWQPGPTGQTHPLPSFASPLPMASAPRGLLRDPAAPWVSPALQGLLASLTRASPLLEASPPSQDHAEPFHDPLFMRTESIPSFSPAFHPCNHVQVHSSFFLTRSPLAFLEIEPAVLCC